MFSLTSCPLTRPSGTGRLDVSLPSEITMPGIEAGLRRAVELGERSVQVAAYLGDELIVDAWIGDIDDSTVFPVFSVSKGITALAVHLQAERGLLDLDAPLAHYWPEYAQNGKEGITARQVLSHRAGVPQMPADVTPESLGDWEWVTRRLAEVEPLFPPGTTNAYHSLSFGWLLGEVVRRTDPEGRPFGRFVHEELCEPLGVDSFWFGIPAGVEPRVAVLSFPDPPPPAPPDAPATLAVPQQVALVPEVFNRTDVQRACIPAVGGIANARSLARLFSPLANRGAIGGVSLLSGERVAGLLEQRPDFDADDATYGRRLPVGVGGFWLEAPGVAEGVVICHPGAGGAVAWAEPDLGLAVAVCHDRMFGVVPEHPFGAIARGVRQVAVSQPVAR
jgi:CubicO group peptidase (beta-lactamase class C family)